jgi:hypothetical protein
MFIEQASPETVIKYSQLSLVGAEESPRAAVHSKLTKQCFISVTVCTTRGKNVPYVSLHCVFRPDGAIIRSTGGSQVSAILPTLASSRKRNRRLYNPNVPEDGPIRPKHAVKGNVWYICATNCVDGNRNKAMSYTQDDAEAQHY